MYLIERSKAVFNVTNPESKCFGSHFHLKTEIELTPYWTKVVTSGILSVYRTRGWFCTQPQNSVSWTKLVLNQNSLSLWGKGKKTGPATAGGEILRRN